MSAHDDSLDFDAQLDGLRARKKGAGTVTGEQLLREFAAKVEKINPEDRFCPLCRALLAMVELVLGREEVRDAPPSEAISMAAS